MSISLVCVCVHVVCERIGVCPSQCAEVMAGPRFLTEDFAPPVTAHFPVAPSVPVSAVRARYQPGQEALGAARQALPAARPWVAVRPPGAHAVPPCSPHGRLQQLVGAMVQGGRELHVEAVKHHGTGLGLCGEKINLILESK